MGRTRESDRIYYVQKLRNRVLNHALKRWDDSSKHKRIVYMLSYGASVKKVYGVKEI